MSNLGLEDYLKKKLRIKLIRTNVGDINVISKMQKNSYILGGEQSGQIILGNFLKTGDGILAALKIMEIMSLSRMKASRLFNLYKQTPQIQINLPIKNKLNSNFNKKLEKVIKSNEINNPDLRYVVRKSGTEPLIRMLIEGYNKDKVVRASKILNNQVKKIIDVQ